MVCIDRWKRKLNEVTGRGFDLGVTGLGSSREGRRTVAVLNRRTTGDLMGRTGRGGRSLIAVSIRNAGLIVVESFGYLDKK